MHTTKELTQDMAQVWWSASRKSRYLIYQTVTLPIIQNNLKVIIIIIIFYSHKNKNMQVTEVAFSTTLISALGATVN